MPFYYLNTAKSVKEFYTDFGSLRDVLKIARKTELVKVNYLMSFEEFTKKPRTIYNGKSDPDVKIFMDWMPADLVLRFFLDKHIHAVEFRIEFSSGIIAECTAPKDLIVYFNQDDRIIDIFDAFVVPYKVRPALLTEPGSLFATVQRTGEHRFYGYFKSIKLWLRQNKFDKLKYAAFYPTNIN